MCLLFNPKRPYMNNFPQLKRSIDHVVCPCCHTMVYNPQEENPDLAYHRCEHLACLADDLNFCLENRKFKSIQQWWDQHKSNYSSQEGHYCPLERCSLLDHLVIFTGHGVACEPCSYTIAFGFVG